MRALKLRPNFRGERIELAIEYGPNYIRQYWEDTPNDSSQADATDRYDVLEYWGVLDAEEADIDNPAELEDWDQSQVNTWV